MKKHLLLVGIISISFTLLAGISYAQGPTHDAAMSALADFFADPLARQDYASQHPDALKAEQSLVVFPPNIQKRLEKVVLMIMQESGANATSHLDSLNASGAEGAFNSFSPAVQREIQGIAKDLEKDPEFMKRARLPK